MKIKKSPADCEFVQKICNIKYIKVKVYKIFKTEWSIYKHSSRYEFIKNAKANRLVPCDIMEISSITDKLIWMRISAFVGCQLKK